MSLDPSFITFVKSVLIHEYPLEQKSVHKIDQSNGSKALR